MLNQSLAKCTKMGVFALSHNSFVLILLSICIGHVQYIRYAMHLVGAHCQKTLCANLTAQVAAVQTEEYRGPESVQAVSSLSM